MSLISRQDKSVTFHYTSTERIMAFIQREHIKIGRVEPRSVSNIEFCCTRLDPNIDSPPQKTKRHPEYVLINVLESFVQHLDPNKGPLI